MADKPWSGMLAMMRRFQRHAGIESIDEAARLMDAMYEANQKAEAVGAPAPDPSAALIVTAKPAKGTH